MSRYARFTNLRVDGPDDDGVVELVLDAPHLNAVGEAAHGDLAEIWRAFDADPDVKAVLLRGEGKGFSAGGVVRPGGEAHHRLRRAHPHDARGPRPRLQHPRLHASPSSPPSTARRSARGWSRRVLADVSVVTKTAKIIDGHTRLGVAAGDHAAVCWPLLCGMAKAKYYLLTCRPLSGEEAERIGLVSLCVDEDDELLPTAREVAHELARRRPAGDPIDQAGAEQLVPAGGGRDLRRLAGAGVLRLRRARGAGGPGVAPRTPRAPVPAMRPLAGLSVVECASLVAGPQIGGMTLAQLGASVIRIDPLGGGCTTTTAGRCVGVGAGPDDAESYYCGVVEQGRALGGRRHAVGRGPRSWSPP